MPKKRRITTDQARLLALRYIQVALNGEAMRATEITSSPYDKVNDYFGDILPARWGDGQTSDQSWEHVWEEAEIQLLLIADSFQTEVKRICKENPDFRYPAYPR